MNEVDIMKRAVKIIKKIYSALSRPNPTSFNCLIKLKSLLDNCKKRYAGITRMISCPIRGASRPAMPRTSVNSVRANANAAALPMVGVAIPPSAATARNAMIHATAAIPASVVESLSVSSTTSSAAAPAAAIKLVRK